MVLNILWIPPFKSHHFRLPDLAAFVVVPAVAGPVALVALGQELQHPGGQLAGAGHCAASNRARSSARAAIASWCDCAEIGRASCRERVS